MITSNLSSGSGSNVTNLNSLNAFILGFGDSYNPANTQITAAALQAVYLSGLSAVNAVDSTLPASTNAKSTRSKAFDLLDKLSTRIRNAFKSLISDASAREHIGSMIHLIQRGRVNQRKSKKEQGDLIQDPSVTKDVTSHKSGYDKQLDNFYKLIQLLESFPAYKPNEKDLTVEALNARYNDLAACNQAVIDTQTLLDKTRITRQRVLYQPVTGLVHLGNNSKSYIKSVFGASSPEYKQISKLKFKVYKS